MKTKIKFEGIQIKSLEQFKRFAKAVEEIEEQVGVGACKFTIKNIFFCSWIDTNDCKETPMERFLIEIIEKMETR